MGGIEPTPATADDLDPRRLVDVEGTFNFRDVGGLATTAGRPLARGRIFRSATLDALTDRGLETIEGLGIRTIIDLRTTTEVEQHGRFPHERVPVRWIHLPAGQGPPRGADDPRAQLVFEHPDPLSVVIRMMVTHSPEPLAEAMRLMAEPDVAPVVFHCTSGKDRTGLLAAVIQLAVGVDLEPVLVDFEHSTRLVSEADLDLRGRYPIMAELPPERIARFNTADRAWVVGALDALGGLDQLVLWLDSIGVDATVRAGLERNLFGS